MKTLIFKFLQVSNDEIRNMMLSFVKAGQALSKGVFGKLGTSRWANRGRKYANPNLRYPTSVCEADMIATALPNSLIWYIILFIWLIKQHWKITEYQL